MWRVPVRPTIATALFLAVTACSEADDSDVGVPEVPTYEGVISTLR